MNQNSLFHNIYN